MTVDISSLPPPDVIEALAFETILAEMKADLVSRYPDAALVIDLESEPMIKLMQVFAYRELSLRGRYNDEARALLLAKAVGADLDHIGTTYYQEARLIVSAGDPSTIPPTPATMESDADYRARLALKPESYSVAGPTQAYRFFAISADGRVKDASVDCPEGGTTRVFVLSRAGTGVPDAEIITTVDAALTPDARRPLSESVIVAPAEIVEYTLDIALTFFAGPSVEVGLSAALAALQKFADDNHRLNADIHRSAIDAAAHVPGVKMVSVITPPSDVICTNGQAPYCTGINITVAGISA